MHAILRERFYAALSMFIVFQRYAEGRALKDRWVAFLARR